MYFIKQITFQALLSHTSRTRYRWASRNS